MCLRCRLLPLVTALMWGTPVTTGGQVESSSAKSMWTPAHLLSYTYSLGLLAWFGPLLSNKG